MSAMTRQLRLTDAWPTDSPKPRHHSISPREHDVGLRGIAEARAALARARAANTLFDEIDLNAA
jgi:hypothetical protein